MKHLLLSILLLASLRASAETLAETAARYEKMGMPNVTGAEFSNITWGTHRHGVIGFGGCPPWAHAEARRRGED